MAQVGPLICIKAQGRLGGGLQARLSCKDVRDKLTGDLGNAIEVIRIGDCFPFRVFAKNS